jgi:DNA polymerase V
MSARVMNNLARFTPRVDVYSIDECFLLFDRHPELAAGSLENYAYVIRQTVMHNTGIPISIGIAPTKTLAKLANKLAKKVNGVCVLDTDEKVATALATYPVADLWGIGRAGNKKLLEAGVETALQFRNMPLEWVKKVFTIQGARMWYELHGTSCIPLKETLDRKKGICTSRGFGRLVDDFRTLVDIATNYASRVAEKLRKDKSCATNLSVRLLTNQFRKDLPQAYPWTAFSLPYPTNSTPDIVRFTLRALQGIYKPGFKFLKLEIICTGLIPESEVQLNAFSPYKGEINNKLSKMIDKLNSHYGAGTLRLATESTNKDWNMRQRYLSPQYTTNWQHIPKVR